MRSRNTQAKTLYARIVVTREHDKQSGRPERYWRDMTHDEIQVKAMEMQDRIARLAAGEEG